MLDVTLAVHGIYLIVVTVILRRCIGCLSITERYTDEHIDNMFAQQRWTNAQIRLAGKAAELQKSLQREHERIKPWPEATVQSGSMAKSARSSSTVDRLVTFGCTSGQCPL